MQCPKCGSEILPGQQFCTKCGQSIQMPRRPNVPQMNKGPQMPPRPIGAPVPPRPAGGATPPRPMSAPQATKAMPTPPRPQGTPVPPKPAGMPQPPRPQMPSQAPQGKGFMSRVAAGAAAALTGGSFREAYADQRDAEHTNEALIKGLPLKLDDAQKTFDNLKKKYPNIIMSEDIIDFGKLIDAAQTAGNNHSGTVKEQNTRIQKALSAIDKKLYELKTATDPNLTTVEGHNDGPKPRQHHISAAEVYDINPDECTIVEHKATWGIQRGQIARRITERELDAVDGLNGVIIQQGCSAMIFVNGELVKIMEAGAYQLQVKTDTQLQKMIEEYTKQLIQNHKDKVRTAEEEERVRLNNLSVAERGGLVGIAGSWIKRGLQFVFGSTPMAKKPSKDEEVEAMKKFKAEAEKIVKEENKQPLLSIILLSNRHFNLIFGSVETEDTLAFNPYEIPMGFLDVKVGVEVEMRISDITSFATNYLTDHNSLTTNDVFRMLNFDVENVLRQELRNQEYTQQGLDGNTKNTLAQKIKASINNRLYGMECTQILNITDSQDDVFGRFRQVEKEIYCSEKELEYMTRTGEIRNRMEQEQNRQLLNSARNKEDYSYAMQQIDKDHMLHDDEMQEFVLMLETQRQIREATTKEEAYEKLLALQGNRLVKEDELEAIKDGIEHDKINRTEITNIMRIQSNRNVEMERQQAEWALDDTKQDHDWEREDLERKRSWGIEDEQRERQWMQEEREYDRQRGRLKAEDDYDFEKMMRQRQVDLEDHDRERQENIEDEERARAHKLEDEDRAYERGRQSKFDDADINIREQQSQTDNLLKIMEAERMASAQEQNAKLELERIAAQTAQNRDNNFANMSADQIRAAQLSHLTGDAQVAMANAYSSDKENEILRQQAERDAKRAEGDRNAAAKDKEQMMDFALKMAGMVKDTASNVSGARQASQQEQIDHLRSDNQRMAQRVDHTQDKALDAVGGVATATASNVAAFNGGAGASVEQVQQPVLQQAAPQQTQPQQMQKGLEQPVESQNSYYLYIDEQQYGPYPMAELQQYVSQGVLTTQTLVYADGMTDWAQAADVPEIAQLFA